MAEMAVTAGWSSPTFRNVWFGGTFALTVGVTVLLAALAGSSDVSGLSVTGAVIFIGSGTHVAATGWFYTDRRVRSFMREHVARYYLVPVALILATGALLTWVISPAKWYVLLIPYFIWQYWHYQKQNFGISALASIGSRAGSINRRERAAIKLSGAAGILGLISHPQLLGLTVHPLPSWCFQVAEATFIAAVVLGVYTLFQRQAAQRTYEYVAIYAISILFFCPVFLFHSPFAAASSFAVAHGFQYLFLMGFVALGDAEKPQTASLILLFTIAVGGGWLLFGGEHLVPTSGINRFVFGAYLGVVMSHFVIDAGLWRLRDQFPREYLGSRVGYLLGR